MFSIVFSAPSCNSLPSKPGNGSVECEGKSLGSMCFFSCNDGYSLIGNEDTLCTQTGEYTSEWNLHVPICVKGKFCGSLCFTFLTIAKQNK